MSVPQVLHLSSTIKDCPTTTFQMTGGLFTVFCHNPNNSFTYDQGSLSHRAAPIHLPPPITVTAPSLSPPPPPWRSSPRSPSSPPLLSEPGWLQTLAEQGPLVHRPQPSTLASVPSVRSQEESTLKLSQGGRRGNCAFTRHRKTFLLRNIVNQI